jgi:hypothetical protein
MNYLVFRYLIHSHRIYHVGGALFVEQCQEFGIGNTILHGLWEPLLQYRRLAQGIHWHLRWMNLCHLRLPRYYAG